MVTTELDSEASLEENNFLFTIGIDVYLNCNNLNNAVSDAKSLAQLLYQKYSFNRTNTIALFNEDATLDNVYDKFKNLIKRIQPRDNLLIYYAGHGAFDSDLNEGYWVPFDARVGYINDYLSNQTILKFVEQIKSHHTLLISDSCFSGSIFDFVRSTHVHRERFSLFPSRWALCSGRNEPVSDGDQYSPFAKHLIEVLSTTEDNEILISELVNEVKLRTASLFNQTPIGGPLRIPDHKGGEFLFKKSSDDLKNNPESVWSNSSNKNNKTNANDPNYLKRKLLQTANELFDKQEHKASWTKYREVLKRDVNNLIALKKIDELEEIFQRKRKSRNRKELILLIVGVIIAMLFTLFAKS